MFPLATQKQTNTEPSEQITVDHSSTSEPSPGTRITQRPSYSPTLHRKPGLMSSSPLSSIASHLQFNRAGSRQAEPVAVQVGQDMVAFPGDFDFENWDLDGTSFDDFAIPPGTVGFLDSVLADHPKPSQTETFQPSLQPAGPSALFEGQAIGHDYFDSYLGTHKPLYEPQFDTLTAVDPQLFAPQSQYGSQYMQPAEFQATPGLTALPGLTDNFFQSEPTVQAQSAYPESVMQPMYTYEDPSASYVTAPYPAQPGYLHNPLPFSVQQTARENATPFQETIKLAPAPLPAKRRYKSDSESESGSEFGPEPGSESDDHLFTNPISGRRNPHKRRRIDGSLGSSLSTTSSLGKQPSMKIARRTGEKPQRDNKKTWVRINTTTRGETSRTCRINEEAETERPYKYQPLPHGNWQTPNGKYRFEYKFDEVAGLDEFKADTMPARKIMTYISKFPSEHLKLWIQVGPSDVARRYGSQEHSRCLFRECPARLYNKHGNIMPGHYRVAFDEKYVSVKEHEKVPNKVLDPYDCTGFVHLTCLERFCDFETICKKANVQVDERTVGKGSLPWETGKARFSMAQRPETALAKYFVKACRKDKLRETEQFKNYPVHVSSCEPKEYKYTLTKALNDIAASNRTRSQQRQFVGRKLGPGQLVINNGDLEIASLDEKIKASTAFKKDCSAKGIKTNQNPLEPFYETFENGIVSRRIAECLALRNRFEAEDNAGLGRTRNKANAGSGATKRKAMTIDEYDSEPDIYDNHGAASRPKASPKYREPGPNAESPYGTRSSSRKRQRVNYSDEQEIPLIPGPSLPPTALPSTLPNEGLQPYDAQGYQPVETSRNESFSHIFAQHGNNYNIDAWQAGIEDDYVPYRRDSVEYADMMNELLRRKSSAFSTNGRIMKSSRKLSAGRQASFATQPISQSREFNINDPPNQVASTPTGIRRSSRLSTRGL